MAFETLETVQRRKAVLDLRKVKPVDRMAKPMDQSMRVINRRNRTNDIGKHTQVGPERGTDGKLVAWHTTQELPWRKKVRVRAANKRARAARKLNRG